MSHPINPFFDDCYFSETDGLAETMHVFVEGSGLREHALHSSSITVGETGFGTGLNLLASILALQANGWEGTLRWRSVELHPLSVQTIAEYLAPFSIHNDLMAVFLRHWEHPCHVQETSWHSGSFIWKKIHIDFSVYIGDVIQMLAALPGVLLQSIDCWMLDGHSPAKNPAMWESNVFRGIANSSRPRSLHLPTSLATYTAAGIVKQGLREAGFRIIRRPGFGLKRHMIQGWYEGM